MNLNRAVLLLALALAFNQQTYGQGVSTTERFGPLPAEDTYALDTLPQLFSQDCSEGKSYPTFHPRPTSYTDVSVGKDHVCAVDSRGLLYCWGSGTHGQLGHKACEGQTAKLPSQVNSVWRFKQVSAGSKSSCALALKGEAYCWGSNESGRLGTGSEDSGNFPEPVKVAGGITFKKIAVGHNHACGQDIYNTLYCWGDNSYGQLGESPETIGYSAIPRKIETAVAFENLVVGGDTTCGLSSKQRTYCWGSMAYQPSPFGPEGDAEGPLKLIAEVSVGSSHICNNTTDSETYCWGLGNHGALGNGRLDDHSVTRPAKVQIFNQYKQIVTGSSHSCGLDYDRTVRCWGNNRSGQLGIGNSDIQAAAQPLIIAGEQRFIKLASSNDRVCAIDIKNQIYCWGSASSSQPLLELEKPFEQQQSFAPKKVKSFPMHSGDLDAYCKSLKKKRTSNDVNHRSVVTHNIGTTLKLKGCAYLSPMILDGDDKTSKSKHEVKRQVHAIVGNSTADEEYVCQMNVEGLADTIDYFPNDQTWETKCSNVITSTVYVPPVRIKNGEYTRMHEVIDLTTILDHDEGFCGLSAQGRQPFLCQPNVCRDDLGNYYGLGEQYGEALQGVPRAEGSSCRAMECVKNENDGSFYEKQVELSATWVWTESQKGAFECRTKDNGCYFEGKFYQEGKSRNKKSEINFTSDKDNTECSYNELKYRCLLKPSQTYEWEPESSQIYRGFRAGQQCIANVGCIKDGVAYKEGETILDSSPINFSSASDKTHCSYSEITKVCKRNPDNDQFYWKNLDYEEIVGYRMGDSCHNHDGCLHKQTVYPLGSVRDESKWPIFESEQDGSQCAYSVNRLKCTNSSGKAEWETLSTLSLKGVRKGSSCVEYDGCYDPIANAVVGFGTEVVRTTEDLGYRLNERCQVTNMISECKEQNGKGVLVPTRNQVMLKDGKTYMEREPSEDSGLDLALGSGSGLGSARKDGDSCERHSNCRFDRGEKYPIIYMKHDKMKDIEPFTYTEGSTSNRKKCTSTKIQCIHGKIRHPFPYCVPIEKTDN